MMNDIAGAMRERQALQEARDIARRKNNSGQTPQGGIGADANGVYGVPSQPSGGICVDANGVYGVNGTPQPNKYTFNESDYIPSAQNGYHLGNYHQTEMYGSPTDFQRQMASNAIGYNLGSFEPRGQTWFPKQNGFGQAINNAENPLNSFTGGSASNFLNPVSFDNSAQVDGGAVKQGANDYLDDRYSRLNYLRDRINAGSRNPFVSATVYDTLIAPIKEEARQDRIREAFRIANTEGVDDKTKLAALAEIATELQKEDLVHDWQYKREKEERERYKWELEKEKLDWLKENGFMPSSVSVRGSSVGGASSVGRKGRPRKYKDGVDVWDYGDDLEDSEREKRITKGVISNFKSDPASKENFLDLVGKFSVLARRNGWSRKQLEKNIYKEIGESTYSKIGEKGFQKIVDSAYNGTATKQTGANDSGTGGDIGEYGVVDKVKDGAGSLLDKLKGMFNYEDRAPHGYNEYDWRWTDKQHDDFAKGREEREELRKQGKLDPYTGRSIDDINKENAETTKNYYNQIDPLLQEALEQEEMEKRYGYE